MIYKNIQLFNTFYFGYIKHFIPFNLISGFAHGGLQG